MKRLTFVSLFLCTGIAASSQSAAPTLVTPDRPGQILPNPVQPIRDFSKPPSIWHFTYGAPQGATIVPSREATHLWDDAKIDPKMIVHPPQSSIGVQPPGSLVAQNEYPNLRVLPIESSSLKPVPTQWPLFHLKAIPLQWLKFQLDPANGAALTIKKSAEK
jgi:hypothetical protein